MKYRKIVEALDRTLYLTGKQGISYQGTQQTAANSDTLWNSGDFLAIVRQVTYCYLLLYQHKMNWLVLLQNTSFKNDYFYR